VSLFSLNVTSKGSVHITLPNIDNEYVHSLYTEQHIPSSSSSLKRLYSQETISTFIKWDKMIKGKSTLAFYSNSLHDDSVQLFHRFARRWIFGNGEKSSRALAYICDINSIVADDLNRPDLKATWQVIKMLFANYDGLQNYRLSSSKNSRSLTKGQHMSDSIGSHRHHHHHHGGRKPTSIEKQQENRLYDDEKGGKSHEQKILPNSKLGRRMDTKMKQLLLSSRHD
jgi:hypothetical protein